MFFSGLVGGFLFRLELNAAPQATKWKKILAEERGKLRKLRAKTEQLDSRRRFSDCIASVCALCSQARTTCATGFMLEELLANESERLLPLPLGVQPLVARGK